jgi:hypothetical protein
MVGGSAKTDFLAGAIGGAIEKVSDPLGCFLDTSPASAAAFPCGFDGSPVDNSKLRAKMVKARIAKTAASFAPWRKSKDDIKE